MRLPSYDAFCKSFDCIKPTEEQFHSVMHNAIRDLMWTYFSYAELDTKLHSTTNTSFDPDGQWAAQELYSSLGMVVFSIAAKLAYHFAGRSFPNADVGAINTAAVVGIYAYDKFASIGAKLGIEALKLSPTMASYFASIFTGFEGPVQTSIITLYKLFTKEEEWTLFREDPATYFKSKGKEMGLSTTLGLIPGAVWQVIFNAGVMSALGPVGTAFLVAATVAVCNLIYAKTSKAILESECCQTWCGATPERDPELPKKEAPITQLLSCLGLFTSCCTKPADSDHTASLTVPINEKRINRTSADTSPDTSPETSLLTITRMA